MGDPRLFQPCLRDDVDLPVSLEVRVQRPDVGFVERDETVLFPAVLVDRRWLIQAVVLLEPVHDRVLDRAEAGLRNHVKAAIVFRSMQDRPQVIDFIDEVVRRRILGRDLQDLTVAQVPLADGEVGEPFGEFPIRAFVAEPKRRLIQAHTSIPSGFAPCKRVPVIAGNTILYICSKTVGQDDGDHSCCAQLASTGRW